MKTTVIKNSCDKLLCEGEYTKMNKKKSLIKDAYWGITLATYLAWSFISFDWHITWIVVTIHDPSIFKEARFQEKNNCVSFGYCS